MKVQKNLQSTWQVPSQGEQSANMKSLHLFISVDERPFGAWSEAPCPQGNTAWVPAFSRAACGVCRWKAHRWPYSPHRCSENVLSAARTRCCVSPASRPQEGTTKNDASWTWGRPGQTGRRAARERRQRCRLGRKARLLLLLFFNSEKQLFCIFVFYVSSCRSFSFWWW